MNATYECPFCRDMLIECEESHYLTFEGWKKGEEITIYVFYCQKCKVTWHFNAEGERV